MFFAQMIPMFYQNFYIPNTSSFALNPLPYLKFKLIQMFMTIMKQSLIFYHLQHMFLMTLNLRLEADNDDNKILIDFCIYFLLVDEKIQLEQNCQK